MRWVDVWTSLGAKVGVLRNVKCVAGIWKRKREKKTDTIVGNGNSVNCKWIDKISC